jgi:hypothetical protein
LLLLYSEYYGHGSLFCCIFQRNSNLTQIVQRTIAQ